MGQSPNSYFTGIRIPNRHFYQFLLVGQHHRFEYPDEVIRPEVKEIGNVFGCGILINPEDKLTIFYTVNGILIGSILNIFYLNLLKLFIRSPISDYSDSGSSISNCQIVG
jgi:hypothetical protein